MNPVKAAAALALVMACWLSTPNEASSDDCDDTCTSSCTCYNDGCPECLKECDCGWGGIDAGCPLCEVHCECEGDSCRHCINDCTCNDCGENCISQCTCPYDACNQCTIYCMCTMCKDCTTYCQCPDAVCPLCGLDEGDVCDCGDDWLPVPDQPWDVHSDPHFRGLDGASYDVTGVAGTVYSILSDAGLAVNARFSTAFTTGLDTAAGLPYRAKGTWVTAVGAVTPAGTLEVHGNGTVVASPGLAVDYDWPRVSLSTESMDLELTLVPPPAAWGVPSAEAADLAHINLSFQRLAAGPRAHGLLGVTGRRPRAAAASAAAVAAGKDGEGVIEGEVADYAVASLLSTSFKYSAFDTGVAPALEG